MSSSATIDQVSQILEDLGFNHETVQGSHHLFLHPSTKAMLMLPLHQTLRPILVTAIARTLDEHGILTRDEFEQRLHETNGAVK